MSKIKIGIAIANFNGGKFFKDCLDGLLSQTMKPHIVVIADDASTDDSVHVIKNVLLTSRGVSEVTTTCGPFSVVIDGILFEVICSGINKGPASARNMCLARLIDAHFCHAIGINDVDDVYYPDKIKKSVEIMMKYPFVSLVYSDFDVKNVKTGTIDRYYKESYDFDRLLTENFISNNSFISAEILKVVGRYDESYFGMEDYQLWIRVSEVAMCYGIKESLYCYTVHGDNITITTPSPKFAEGVIRLKKEAMERRQKNGK